MIVDQATEPDAATCFATQSEVFLSAPLQLPATIALPDASSASASAAASSPCPGLVTIHTRPPVAPFNRAAQDFLVKPRLHHPATTGSPKPFTAIADMETPAVPPRKKPSRGWVQMTAPVAASCFWTHDIG